VKITYTISPINPLASGYIDDGSGVNFYTKTKTVTIGTNLSATATATNNSTFIGWGFSSDINDILTNNTTITHIAEYDVTYYAIVNKEGVVSKEFCYFADGSTKDDACIGCENIVNVFFNENDLKNNGIGNITWYLNESLTTTIANGLYKLNVGPSIESLAIYSLTNGNPTMIGVCDSDPLTCCEPL
jgi:hypothetical protein